MKRLDYAETQAILAAAAIIGFAIALIGLLFLVYITTGGTI